MEAADESNVQILCYNEVEFAWFHNLFYLAALACSWRGLLLRHLTCSRSLFVLVFFFASSSTFGISDCSISGSSIPKVNCIRKRVLSKSLTSSLRSASLLPSIRARSMLMSRPPRLGSQKISHIGWPKSRAHHLLVGKGPLTLVVAKFERRIRPAEKFTVEAGFSIQASLGLLVGRSRCVLNRKVKSGLV